jgi:hypothetical protein
LKELREGNAGRPGIADEALACGPQSRDGKGHGDAVVTEGVQLRGLEALLSRNKEAVAENLHAGP